MSHVASPVRRSLLGLAALAVAGATLAGPVPAATAETCLPIPGLPCLPDLPGGPTASTPATIEGPAKVDATVTAVDPTWSDPSTVTTYQWRRDDAPISGATEKTYLVQLDDLGAQLTVAATGTVRSLFSTTSVSDPVTVLRGDAPVVTRAPALSGDPSVGGTLTATSGTWAGSPTPTFTYQWYLLPSRGPAVAISSASTPTYQPRTADIGGQLAIVVTATRPGHLAGRAASAAVAIARLASATKLTSKARRVSAKKRPVVRVALSSPGSSGVPSGRVSIFEGRKKLATTTVPNRGARGAKNVTLPRLSKGRHRLVARYAGTATYARSSSPRLVLTITR